jgi:hypothetical protein
MTQIPFQTRTGNMEVHIRPIASITRTAQAIRIHQVVLPTPMVLVWASMAMMMIDTRNSLPDRFADFSDENDPSHLEFASGCSSRIRAVRRGKSGTCERIHSRVFINRASP